MRYIRCALRNERGTVLMTVMMVMLILSIIAIGAIQASANNITAAKKVDNYERLYYGAESAANAAAETLRKEVAEYYNLMAAETMVAIEEHYNSTGIILRLENCIPYINRRNGFDTQIVQNSREAYQEPRLTEYEFGAITTHTTFSDHVEIIPGMTADDPDIHRFTILCTAMEGDVTRTFESYVDIPFIDINLDDNRSDPPDFNYGLVVGGQLQLNEGGIKLKVNGDAATSTMPYEDPGFLGLNPSNFTCWNRDDPDFIQPEIADKIDWELDFDAMLRQAREDLTLSMPGAPGAPALPGGGNNINHGDPIRLTGSPNPAIFKDSQTRSITVEPRKSSDVTTNAIISSNGALTVRCYEEKLLGIVIRRRILTISGSGGALRAAGDLSIDSRTNVSGTESNPTILHSVSGSVSAGANAQYTRIHAGGGSISVGGQYLGKGTESQPIRNYASGSITMNNSSNGASYTTMQAGSSITMRGTLFANCNFYAGGSLDLTGTRFTDCVLYAGSGMSLDGEYVNCVIYANGNLSLDGTFTSCEIHTNGSFTLENSARIEDSFVYAGGSTRIRNSTDLMSSRIYCNGNLTYDTTWSLGLDDWAYAENCMFIVGGTTTIGQYTIDSIILSRGAMTLNGAECDNALYYSNGDMNFRGIFKQNVTNGVFYTNGKVDIDSNIFTTVKLTGGQIICKGDMLLEKFLFNNAHTITYNPLQCDTLLQATTLYDPNGLNIIPKVIYPPIITIPVIGIDESIAETP
ncbi:MAG: hypothetical protein ACOX7W_09250 [Christensenellales bacterium]|jgi:hypothetical protein